MMASGRLSKMPKMRPCAQDGGQTSRPDEKTDGEAIEKRFRQPRDLI